MIEAISFDCYGTLIDWGSGIVKALKPLLISKGIDAEDEKILKLYAELEAKAEGMGYMPYREVLRTVVYEMGERFGFTPSRKEQECIAESISTWEPFSDTVEALNELKKNFKLALISNVDDNLLSPTLKKLEVNFEWIITSEQAKSYKPSLNNFTLALKLIGLPSSNILHAAQSVYHDIIPAKKLGMSTALVLREGYSAAPAVSAEADIKVKDLRELVEILR
jgi:2-haloacid dehalogenase